MLIFSHRGNIAGSIPYRENRIEYIQRALNFKTFNVEVDLQAKDGNLYFGHDECQEEIDLEILTNRQVICHCKTLEALNLVIETNKTLYTHKIEYFYHENDAATLTSISKIWLHPRSLTNELNSFRLENYIAVLPEQTVLKNDFELLSKFYGICTDFPELYRKEILKTWK